MISRPNYKDYLNHTLSHPENPAYPRTPNADSRPPLPHPKRFTLPFSTDSSQTSINPIDSDIKDRPFLRQTFDTYGSKRINSLKKKDSSRSAKDLSGRKGEKSPLKTSMKQELPYYSEVNRDFLDPKKEFEPVTKECAKNSYPQMHQRDESRSKGNIYTSYDLYKSSLYPPARYFNRPQTSLVSPKQTKEYLSLLDPKKLPTGQDRSRDRTPRSREGPDNGPSLNLFTPIQFRNKGSLAQRSDPRDYRPTSKERGKSPFRAAQGLSPFRKQEREPARSALKMQKKIVEMNGEGKCWVKEKLSVQDFMVGKKLGEGRFGHVFMVVHKATQAIFALKRVLKSVIKQSMMMNQFALEVRLQSSFYHPNIVSLYAVFDDNAYVYLLTEYLSDGSLYSELKKKGKFEEEEAASRVYSLCRAIQALHLRGVAHRDIKPENIMMCAKQCKLGDFGWATICDTRRMTYCGTTDYVSPEIVEGKEYGEGVDMWCVGVLAFELLSGRPPFYHLSRQQTFKKIEEATPCYPSYFSVEAKDFISKLLKKVPEERMSSVDALLHPFLGKAEK